VDLAYDNYFEALPPKISLDKFDVWYHHPYSPIKVNEVGYAECTDPNLVFYEPDAPGLYALRFVDGAQKAKYRKVPFLFCCYHGLSRAPRVILYLDGNPYNCTKSNLIGVNYAPPDLIGEALHNTHQFIRNTIEFIPIKIQKYSKFWTANEVVNNLKIPQFYIEFWQHPTKFKKFIEENEKAVEISIRKKIYKKNQLNYS
jgi:hypothetical protein